MEIASTVKAKPNHDSTVPSKNHLETLQKYFGHSSFRPLQWQIIHSIMEEKRDNCVIMATGYGKSLCYQYPAVYKNGLSIVISPLISLMEDQVKALEVSNIPACLLGTAQSKKEEVTEDLLNGVYRLLYITPEFATGDSGSELLRNLHDSHSITLLAIDEAHCVSHWGHDFRPAYRNIGGIRNVIQNVPILAVTATATDSVKTDIIKLLKLRSPQLLCTGFDRPNLYFKVEKKSGDPYADIIKVINNDNKIFNIAQGSVIIYCITKKVTEEIVELLSSKGIKCEPYHAGLSLSKRKNAHDLFIKDDIKVIVATIAFGMGIDKPNVRCVIHYGASSDMESYYQEAGRAGRDGNPSLCILYHSPVDFTTHTFLRMKSQLNSAIQSHKASLNMLMQQYVSSRECRRYLIMSHFDKSIHPPTVLSQMCCDNCSNKSNSSKHKVIYEGVDSSGFYDFSEDVEKFLLAMVCILPRTFGVGKIIAILRGSKAKNLPQEYYTCAEYGSGKSKSEVWWKQIALILEQEKIIEKECKVSGNKQMYVIVLSNKGEKWLNDRKNNKAKPVLIVPNQEIIQYLKVKSTNNVQPSYNLVEHEWNSKAHPKENFMPNVTKRLTNYEDNLLNELFKLRYKLAREGDVIPHTIMSDVALNQLARNRPTSMNQLISGKFDGMSEMKINKFGNEIVHKINEYCQNKTQSTLDISGILENYPVPHSKTFPVNNLSATQRLSIELFNSGKPPEEIAQQRNMVRSTIMNHLAFSLKTTEAVDVTKLITAPKLICISDIIKSTNVQNDMSSIGTIKRYCPVAITYDDIKIAIAYIETRNHLNDLKIPYEDKAALDYDKKCFQSKIVRFDNSTSVEKVPEKAANIIKSKKNPESDINLWEDDVDFMDNFNEIEEILDVSDRLDKTNEEATVLHDSTTDASITDDTEFPDSSNDQIMANLKSDEPECSTNTLNLESLPGTTTDSKNQSSTSQTKSTDSNIVQINKRRKMYANNESEDEDSTTQPVLPAWMKNSSEVKKNMKKKISKNTLFN